MEPAVTHLPPELGLLTEHLLNSPVTAKEIRLSTQKDPELSLVTQYLRQVWPGSCKDDQLTPYFSKRTELSLYNGCILWGNQVIVPATCRDAVLAELHKGHPGMARMKGLSHMYVWWPGISADIEKVVRQCPENQVHQPSPIAAPLHPWSWPTHPWARIHLDYAGPIKGKTLIEIDAH